MINKQISRRFIPYLKINIVKWVWKKSYLFTTITLFLLIPSFGNWPGLRTPNEINENYLNDYLGIVINKNYLKFTICESICTLFVTEEGDTSFHERRGSVFALKGNGLEHEGMPSFRLKEIRDDSLVFKYPIPRFVRRSISCDSSFGTLTLSKSEIDGLITPAGPAWPIGLFMIEAVAFGYSAISFWKYGDEVSGVFWPVCGGLMITIPAIHAAKDPDISFLESSGGLGVLGYAVGLIALGGLNLALGDKYSRKEVYWGNVIGINASVALGFGIGALSSRIREKRRWKISK